MKRRELIKNGLIAAGAAAIGAAGGMKINSKTAYNPSDTNTCCNIVPKQTKQYSIDMPLPFNFELIDKMKEMNSKYKKMRIKTVYNNLPFPTSDILEDQFQSNRGENHEIKCFNDFAQYVQYAKKLGFNFVYILNSPKPFSEYTFNKLKPALFELLDNLYDIGCNEIKIANHQLVKIISEERPKFKLSASTSFEFHNISQYYNLLTTYPNIKSINTSIDDNRNFHFLSNLKKMFPNVDIELMVNERCIHGCPARISHPASFFRSWPCWKINGNLKYFLKLNIIYPWQLDYYSSIGINTFKFVVYNFRANITDIACIDSYMKCLEYGIDYINADEFFNLMFGSNIKIKNDVMLSEIMPYLPDIKHFVENGNKCANICGVECKYCLKGLKEIEKIIGA